MKNKWTYGLVAVCSLVLAGCTTGGSNNSSSGSAASSESNAGTGIQCCGSTRNAKCRFVPCDRHNQFQCAK